MAGKYPYWQKSLLFAFGFPERSSLLYLLILPFAGSVGTMNTAKSTEVFLQGCRKMCLKIKPEAILIYGKIPDFDFGKIKIFHYCCPIKSWKKEICSVARRGGCRRARSGCANEPQGNRLADAHKEL